MFALQASIGGMNDLVDAPRDAGRKAGKPIPAGLVSRSAAQAVVVAAAAVGLILTVPSGALTVALAVVVLAIGYGTVQRAAINRALVEKRPLETAPWPVQTLTFGGIGLGLLTALLILLG